MNIDEKTVDNRGCRLYTRGVALDIGGFSDEEI